MTVTTETRRFLDADVIADPSLRQVAERYVRGYIGGFPELLGARRILLDGDTLNTSQIRMVLNCMLTSTGVLNMPQPPYREPFNASFVSTDGWAEPALRARGWNPTPIRRPFNMRARPRLPFIYSTNPRAYNIHLIREVKVTFYPAATQHSWHERFSCSIKCWCAENWMGGRKYLRVASLAEACGLVEEGRRWCKICDAGFQGAMER